MRINSSIKGTSRALFILKSLIIRSIINGVMKPKLTIESSRFIVNPLRFSGRYLDAAIYSGFKRKAEPKPNIAMPISINEASSLNSNVKRPIADAKIPVMVRFTRFQERLFTSKPVVLKTKTFTATIVEYIIGFK